MEVVVKPEVEAREANSIPKAIGCLTTSFLRQTRGIVTVEKVETNKRKKPE